MKRLSCFFFSLTILFYILSCQNGGKPDSDKPDNTQNPDTELKNASIVIFSSLQQGRGNVKATVDGKEISSGDRVQKGKIVIFSATPLSKRYIMQSWKGASYSDDNKEEALLRVKDEGKTYTVRASFASMVTFLRINSGTVNGADVVPDVTKEKLDSIIDNEDTITVKGPSCTMVVASHDTAWNAKSFKVNGKETVQIPYDVYKATGLKIFKDLPVGTPFDVNVEMSAGDDNFSFKFKLLREEGKIDVPKVNLAIDEKKPEPLTENTLQELSNESKPHFYSKKDPEVEISSSADEIKEVELLDVASGVTQKLTPAVQNMAIGKKYFTRFYIDDVPMEGVGLKELQLTIKPKNTESYNELVWKFCLKQFDETDSPEFQGAMHQGGRFEPNIIKGVEFYDGKQHNFIDDYGALKLKLTCQTVSKESSVYWQFFDMQGNPLANTTETLLTNNNNYSHVSEKIPLFADKPTRIKVWVVSKTGKKRNDSHGVWDFTANPIEMRLGYVFTNEPSQILRGNNAYVLGWESAIFDKNKVKDGKIYLAFGMWNAFTVSTEGLSPFQKPFVKCNENLDNVQIQFYITEVDVSSILKGEKDSLPVVLPILENGVKCFTYTVQVKGE